MVFHRFLEGGAGGLSIFINGSDAEHRLRAWDPFMKDHDATISTPLERLATPRGDVEVQGFVLPHKDHLKHSQFESGGGPDGWTAQQGFYVYRKQTNAGLRRLAGSWARAGVDQGGAA